MAWNGNSIFKKKAKFCGETSSHPIFSSRSHHPCLPIYLGSAVRQTASLKIFSTFSPSIVGGFTLLKSWRSSTYPPLTYPPPEIRPYYGFINHWSTSHDKTSPASPLKPARLSDLQLTCARLSAPNAPPERQRQRQGCGCLRSKQEGPTQGTKSGNAQFIFAQHVPHGVGCSCSEGKKYWKKVKMTLFFLSKMPGERLDS